MTTPNYMTEKLKISDELARQLKSSDLEMTLIHRVMDNSGWSFPGIGDPTDDYDIAVEEVKWYIKQLLELAG